MEVEKYYNIEYYLLFIIFYTSIEKIVLFVLHTFNA
jgi:hypothetical protein